MQPPGGLQTNHRRPNDTARSDQPLELINTIAQHRQRDRLADQSPLATGQPHSIERLARIDRNNKRARGHLTAQQLQGAPPSSKAERKTLPASAERVNPKPTSETYQRTSAARRCEMPGSLRLTANARERRCRSIYRDSATRRRLGPG